MLWLESAYATALAWGVFSVREGAAAWVTTTPRRSSWTTRASVRTGPLHAGGLGWDNENFLEALSGGDEALEKANEQYRAQSRFDAGNRSSENDDDDEDDEPLQQEPSTPPSPLATTKDELPSGSEGLPGAVLTDEMKAKIKASHTQEEEASQGGKLFREMMARAQKTGGLMPPPPPPPPAPPQQQPQQAPVAPQMPAGYENLSVEEQAQLFRQMMQQQQQQAAPPQPAADMPPPVTRSRSDGRRVGRNRDADAIVNTSDVYFAQLKLDSSLRNVARYSGNDEKANAVFDDPAIQEIKMHVNPYIEEMKKQEQAMLETSADELLLDQRPVPQELHRHTEKSYAGPSYKDKLAAKKKKQKQQGGGTTATTISVPEPSSAETQEEIQSRAPPQEPAMASSPPLPSEQAAVEAPVEVMKPSTTTTDSTAAAAAGDKEEGDLTTTRSDIRTLMGLLLKHRGGPGFGSGRLQGAEIERFDTLASDLLAKLQQEADLHKSSGGEASGGQEDVHVAAAPVTQAEETSPISGDKIDSMISCIEGATQMYKNSPPELQEGVLVTLRAALLSAVSSLNEIIGNDQMIGSSTTTTTSSAATKAAPVGERINSLISCVEGAVQMYKNSPPELKEGVLVTLRAALISAISTLNEILANNEVKNLEAYHTATATATTTKQKSSQVSEADSPKKPSTTTSDFYDVIPTKQEEEAPVAVVDEPAQATTASAATRYSGTDENSHFLEQVYAKLQKVAGEGKMGLRADLSENEATELADDIAKMRALLVDELDSGIPEASSSNTKSEQHLTTLTGAETEAPESGTSKYQQMLAKARAEKAAKKKE